MTHAEVVAQTWEGATPAEWQALWGVPELHVYRLVGSTNDVARRLADAGAPAGTVVLADEQTAGRGRGGRRWHAPAGLALLLSILVRPRPAPDAVPGAAPLRVGLAVARAIEKVAAVRVAIKWPNDIVIPGAGKLAGILCEGDIATPQDPFLIAGIGINIGQSSEDLPPAVYPPATSLYLSTGRAVPRAALAGAIIEEVLDMAPSATAPLTGGSARELGERDALRGRPITVDGESRGVAMGIAPDGALIARGDRGETHIRSGTIRTADGTDSGETVPT